MMAAASPLLTKVQAQLETSSDGRSLRGCTCYGTTYYGTTHYGTTYYGTTYYGTTYYGTASCRPPAR